MFTKELRAKIEADFEAVKAIAINRAPELFTVFNQATPEEIDCLMFLFAYSPVSDFGCYSGELYLKVVQDSLKAKNETSWGKRISTEDFLNYVLGFRLNNEDLTDHRGLFFDTIYPRVKDLSLTDAILEINYWCLENATYQTTDIRTMSPLTMIRNAFGRCGEESVLLCSALRSLSIPARQCYTPRWAHCDDNHAWVEVLIDGTWHLLEHVSQNLSLIQVGLRNQHNVPC